LFSVSAATSLAEERSSGSLDVLLTTPLPARSIVLGKWWGTFRTVPLFAVPNALGIATVLVFDAEISNVLPLAGCRAALQFLLICAYGATITSLGLALAIWVRRVGRAVAWSITGFVFMAIAPLLAASQAGSRGAWIAVASPLAGLSSDWVDVFDANDASFAGSLGPCLLWIVIYTTTALVLRSLTLTTFDRSLGRVRQRGGLWSAPRKVA
jgi:ABC-type Na+ efflux pump permease subunit